MQKLFKKCIIAGERDKKGALSQMISATNIRNSVTSKSCV